jgi:uncharacterized protein (DUF2141 family)
MKARTILLHGFCLLLLQAWPAGHAVSQDTHGDIGTIVVGLAGVEVERGGVIVVALHRGAEGWLKLESAVQKKSIPVALNGRGVTFENVPYGRYAIQILHDSNENGKLDFRWFPFPKPKEGAGVSNNDHRKGRPSYEKAEFTLDEASVVMRIQMRY